MVSCNIQIQTQIAYKIDLISKVIKMYQHCTCIHFTFDVFLVVEGMASM